MSRGRPDSRTMQKQEGVQVGSRSRIRNGPVWLRAAVNQIETHPFHQRLADHEVMRDRGVLHESCAPFAERKNNLFTDPLLTEIAAAHGKSVAQVFPPAVAR